MEISFRTKAINRLSQTSLLQQSRYWGNVKQIQGWEVKAFDLEVYPEGKAKQKEDLLLFLNHAGNEVQMAYVPYGPKKYYDEEQRGIFLEEVSEGLKSYLPGNCIFIRYDLPWNSPWGQESDRFDSSGNWLGPPENRIRELRMNFGTRFWNLRKTTSDILPSSTLLINLEHSEQEIFAQMKPKTRYNIRLAVKKGVKVREIETSELPVLYQLYKETAERNKLTVNSYHHLDSMVRARVNCPEMVKVLLAEYNGKPLAGMILVISERTGTYLFGASATEHRNLMGSYLLQWEAMKLCKMLQCTQYDMFGISPVPDPAHPLYGLYRFKTGFGGKKVFRQGCWDYPLQPSIYATYRSAELTFKGYHG